MQDVLFKVYRKVGAFRGDAALASWISRITFNAARSRLRTAKYQRTPNDELSMTAGQIPTVKTLMRRASRAEALEVLEGAMRLTTGEEIERHVRAEMERRFGAHTLPLPLDED